MIEEFASRARDAGAHVRVAASPGAAAEECAAILRDKAARLVALSEDLGEAGAIVRQLLSDSGCELVHEGESVSAVEKADAGVTGAALGVVETGSILVEGNELPPRIATMLPLVHIALLREDALVPSLMEAGEHLRASALGLRGARPVTHP